MEDTLSKSSTLKNYENIVDALEYFIELLENSEYFIAHEVLESAWHPLRLSNDSRKNLAKGLINAAIAFEHLKRDKEKSPRVAKKAISAYDRYKSICSSEIEDYLLFSKACNCVDRIRLEFGI